MDAEEARFRKAQSHIESLRAELLAQLGQMLSQERSELSLLHAGNRHQRRRANRMAQKMDSFESWARHRIEQEYKRLVDGSGIDFEAGTFQAVQDEASQRLNDILRI